MKSVCIYCGSSGSVPQAYLETAGRLGMEIAARDLTLVYGGAHVGSMGAVADAALRAGGRVTGVIPRSLVDMEVAHNGLSEIHVVESMHDRKALMAELSDAFVALPGGFGTLDELFEIVTWALLGFHGKPIILFNQDGYYDHLLAFLKRAGRDGFIRPKHQSLFEISTRLDDLLATIDLRRAS